jgi:hypothetical protein
MTAHAEDMVLVLRAELGALRAENRRLRREAGDREALKHIRSDCGKGVLHSRGTGGGVGESVSDRVLASRTGHRTSLRNGRSHSGTPPTG